jgi:type VI secretion system protein VasJ
MPRASGLAEFENSLSGNLLESTLICCENLFFEPGFQLLFDLQFKLFQYLEANHRSDLSRFIQNTLQELLERHPQLLELQFEDGTPFANPECRQWVQQNSFSHINKADKTLGNESSVDESMARLIETATQLAKRKKLPEALHSLHVLPEGTEQQRIQKHLAQARLCLAAGKAKIADVILEEIQKTILAYHLATWNPGLAIEILQQRLTALQTLKKSGSSEEKQRISQQWHEVWHLICKIDVASAAALSPG